VHTDVSLNKLQKSMQEDSRAIVSLIDVDYIALAKM